MLEFIDRDFQTVIITIFHMLKKVKESPNMFFPPNMLKRDTEDIKKDSIKT